MVWSYSAIPKRNIHNHTINTTDVAKLVRRRHFTFLENQIDVISNEATDLYPIKKNSDGNY